VRGIVAIELIAAGAFREFAVGILPSR